MGTWTNVSYMTAPYTKAVDIYTPTGTAPPSGWPVAVWVHGGRWVSGGRTESTSDENYLFTSWKDHLLARGIAVASADYSLSIPWYINLNDGPCHPWAIKDIKTCAKYLQDNASTYGIDPNRFFVSGHSAGTHIALMAAFSNGDTNTYVARQNGVLNDFGNGFEPGGRGNQGFTTSYSLEYQFNYKTWQSGKSGPYGSGLTWCVSTGSEPLPFVGVYVYAPIVDLDDAATQQWPANAQAVRFYAGRWMALDGSSGDNIDLGGELNIDDYLLAPSGTIFATARGTNSTITPNISVASHWSTGDSIIPPSSGATPLYNVLTGLGINAKSAKAQSTSGAAALGAGDVARPGLTQITSPASTTHAQVVFRASPDDFVNWAKSLLPSEGGGTSEGTGGTSRNVTWNRTKGALSACVGGASKSHQPFGPGNYDLSVGTYDDVGDVLVTYDTHSIGSTTYEKAGGATATGTAGATEVTGSVESGGGLSAGTAGATRVVTNVRGGPGWSSGVAGGTDVVARIEGGGGQSAGAAGALDVAAYVEAGGALSAGTGDGTANKQTGSVDHPKAGGGLSAGTGGADDVVAVTDGGGAVSAGTGGTGDVVAAIEGGGAIAAGTAGATRATAAIDAGGAVSAGTGGASKVVARVDGGGAVSAGTGGASKAVAVGRAGGGATTSVAGGRRLLSWDSVITGIDETTVTLGDGWGNFSVLDEISTYDTDVVFNVYAVSVRHGG